MNLDDFIMPNSIASPTDNSPSPTTDSAMTSSNAVASAIPIKAKKETQDLNQFPPSAPPQDRITRNREFDYVQRRLRKTSIDETRVGGLGNKPVLNQTNANAWRHSHANGQQSFLLRSNRPTAS